ncbi:Glycine--tRNA ligase [Handroanthus impetiginosus]|uniref:glycine--tRNA ligase n=1 Tax=Handroanthus impetiginosus TaxID=429701 RepID=A0A2G9HM52_9LAMI|nr:Glycine--tRNA ligase [Handroanthus impetiginosus]
MAILSLPLVTSILHKPPRNYKSHLLFLLTAGQRVNPSPHVVFRSKGVSPAAANLSFSTAAEQDSQEEPPSSSSSVLTFQQAIQRLQKYWASVGCAVMQCSNTEVGAGTMNPHTFLRVLGPEPWNVAYVEPSIRPDDSRYGENPNRLQRHTQFQVILKPDPGNSQDLFIRSLSALGINVNDHDIRFVEDNWESPVLGAWGLGWEIWMDGMEITQFTYFQQAGSLQLMPVSVEITYGLERILMLLQGVDHFKKIQYADGITYGELFLENEKEMSAYYLEHASVDHIHKHFDLFEAEARRLLESGLAIPAYDQLLKTSHAFNVLDSRGFVGVTERARYFGRMRSLARQCAQLWSKTRESLGHPLGIASYIDHLGFPKEDIEELKKKVSAGPRTFLLEIGTEELPPNDVVNACSQLKDLVKQLLEKQRLSHGDVRTFGTPRRLVHVDTLCDKQVSNQVELRGPPASKAFDQQGNPTKAAKGFCRRNGVPLSSLYRRVEG